MPRALQIQTIPDVPEGLEEPLRAILEALKNVADLREGRIGPKNASGERNYRFVTIQDLLNSFSHGWVHQGGGLYELLTQLSAFDTDDLAEGANLYFTNERVDDRVANLIQDGTGLAWTYDDGAGTLTGNVSLVPFDTDDLAEGANLYYTDERAQDAVGAILADDGDIDFNYDDTIPKITATVKAGVIPQGYYSPLTNGDAVAPELIFASGDAIMIWNPL